jgi:hypothetical protein
MRGVIHFGLPILGTPVDLVSVQLDLTKLLENDKFMLKATYLTSSS